MAGQPWREHTDRRWHHGVAIKASGYFGPAMRGGMPPQRPHYLAMSCLVMGAHCCLRPASHGPVGQHRSHPVFSLSGRVVTGGGAKQGRSVVTRARLACAAAALTVLACIWHRVRCSSVARQARATDDEATDPVSSESDVRLGEVLYFALPLMFSSVASTSLGTVDSAFVGRCGGTLQLAALAPATSLMECLSYMMSFIAIGTLSVLAALGQKSDNSELHRLLWRSLAAAAGVGIIVAGTMFLGATHAVRLCGAHGAMVPFAASYVAIRAIGVPFDVIFRVANAGLLATRDPRTGLMVVLLQSAVNAVIDIAICPKLGITGAAWSTVLSQILGCALLIGTLRWRGLIWWFQPPSLRDALHFLAFALPVCLTLSLKVAAVQLLNFFSSSGGIVDAAAHQVTKSVYWFFALIAAESLSSTGQALLPRPMQMRDHKRTKQTLRILLALALFGSVSTAVALFIGISYGLFSVFSHDALVVATVPRVPLMICVVATPFAFCLEGALIAARRQRWMSQRLLILTATAGVLFFQGSGNGALCRLWGVFAAYVLGRVSWYGWGIWNLCGVVDSGVVPKDEDSEEYLQMQ